jgi:hypothetical protein
MSPSRTLNGTRPPGGTFRTMKDSACATALEQCLLSREVRPPALKGRGTPPAGVLSPRAGLGGIRGASVTQDSRPGLQSIVAPRLKMWKTLLDRLRDSRPGLRSVAPLGLWMRLGDEASVGSADRIYVGRFTAKPGFGEREILS